MNQLLSPPGPRPPKSVTILGTFGMVVAALSLLCNVSSVFMLLALDKIAESKGQPNPMAPVFKAHPEAQSVMVAGMTVRMGLAFVLLIGSIGVLALKSWGRKALIAYALVWIVATIAETILGLTIVIPAFASVDPSVRQPMMVKQFGSQAVQLIYPILVLIFMNKRHIKDAFAAAPGA